MMLKALAIPPPPDNEFCFLEGECAGGLTLGNNAVQNAQECLDECQDNLSCQYYTYYEGEEVCFLFSNCPDVSVDSCDACFSGSQVCLGKRISSFESSNQNIRFGMQFAGSLQRHFPRWVSNWFWGSSRWLHWGLQWQTGMPMVFVRATFG